MKKILAFLMSLVMMLSFSACTGDKSDDREDSTEKESVTEEKKESFDLIALEYGRLYDSEWCDDGKLYEYDCEILQVGDEEDEYALLAKELEKINDENREFFETNAVDMIDSAYSEYNSYGYRYFPHYDDLFYRVVRADEVMVSVLETRAGYWGGMHPNSGHGCLNLDSATGKVLTLDDISTDRTALEALIYDALVEKYGNDGVFFNLEEDLQSYIDQDALIWTLSYQGITFYFSPYMLASYAAGLITADISFSEHSELFEDKYLQGPQCYAMPLKGAIGFDLDPADGKTDEIVAYTNTDMYDMQQWTININGEIYEDDVYAYSAEAYLVHFEDGNKNYVYVEYEQDSGYVVIGVYEINGNNVTNVGYVRGSGMVAKYDGEKVMGKIFNDPNNLTLGTRSDMLSTTTVYRDYYVDPDTGMPMPKEDCYIMDVNHTLTSLIDLEVEILGEDEPEIIKAGEEFEFYQTDNETYVDMKLSDGRICRLKVDCSAWPYTVNGIDSEECFDGMMYAG